MEQIQELTFGDSKYDSPTNKQESKPKTQNRKHKTMCKETCIKTQKIYYKTPCVVKFQITKKKQDLKTHNLGLYLKH